MSAAPPPRCATSASAHRQADPQRAGDVNASAREYAQTIPEGELIRLVNPYSPPNFAYPPGEPKVFVKYGYCRFGDGVLPQADMQRLAWEWLRDERRRGNDWGFDVPEVYRVLSINPRGVRGGEIEFMITELLDDAHVTEEFAWTHSTRPERSDTLQGCYDKIAEAVQAMRRIPVPPNASPGPYTTAERIIHHCFFKGQRAPIQFNTVCELQDFINRVAASTWKPRVRPGGPLTVELEEKLEFCYTDFNDENFMFSQGPGGPESDRLYVVDFGHAAFLPITFLLHAVKSGQFLAPVLDQRIGGQLPEKDLLAMNQATYSLNTGSTLLGLTQEQRQARRRQA